MFFKILLISFPLIYARVSLANNLSNKLYFIEEKRFLTRDAADKECKSMGMNLASIKTKEELDYLKEYIQHEYGRIYPYWLGAYKLNGQWIWSGSGEKIQEFFWHQGEPNDKSGNEICVHTWEAYFDWNDNDCERELPFICDVQA